MRAREVLWRAAISFAPWAAAAALTEIVAIGSVAGPTIVDKIWWANSLSDITPAVARQVGVEAVVGNLYLILAYGREIAIGQSVGVGASIAAGLGMYLGAQRRV